MERTLEGRAAMVLDPSLNQSGLRKGVASTSDFIICFLSRIGGQLERAFAKIIVNECARVPHARIVGASDKHALVMKQIVTPTTLVSAPVGKLDPGGPMNDTI